MPQEAEPDDAQHEDDGDEADEEDFHGPKPKRQAKSAATPKVKGTPPAKKVRVAKATGPKTTKAIAKRGRKPKIGEDAYDAAQVAKDTKITADNPLFSAVAEFAIHIIANFLAYRCCYESICRATVNSRRLLRVP